MKKIILSILILVSTINADIIYLTIMKKGNDLEAEIITMNDKETIIKDQGTYMDFSKKKKNQILSIPIANFWLTKDKIIYKYKHFEVLNRKDIKKPFTIPQNNLKIMIEEKNYMEKFKIRAKPDRAKYYWKEIEKNHTTYSSPELKKMLSKEDYKKIMHEINY